MKQIARILIVVIIAGVVSALIATPIDKVLYKYRRHDAKRLAEIYESTTAYDILFIGSSRTHRSIYPKVIDSILGMSSFNAGTESGEMPDFRLTLDGYLINHPAPKLVVLTIDLTSFIKANDIHFYPQYYPYLNNKAVAATLSKCGYGVNMVRTLPFMMITDFDDFSKENAIQKLRGRDTGDISEGDFEYKGFISNSDSYIRKPELEKIKKVMRVSQGTVSDLYEMVKECKDKKIQLIFTYAPEYNFNLQKTRTNTDSVFRLITQTAISNGIPYLRDDSLPICKDPTLFANNGHLNKPGAIVYSAILAEEIKKVWRPDKN